MLFLHLGQRVVAHRFLALGLVACVFSVAPAAPANAASIRILGIKCFATQENDGNGDELRLEVRYDTGNTLKFVRHNMKKGSEWAFSEGHVPFTNKVTLKLIETDTIRDGVNFRDETLGEFTLSPTANGKPLEFKAHGARYVLDYEIRQQPARELELISLQCVTTQEKDSNGDELRLRIKPDNKSQFTLSKNGVKKSAVWNLAGKRVQFFDKVTFTLVEEDTASDGLNFRDENLGSHVAKPAVFGPGLPQPNTQDGQVIQQRFTGHGANYILRYRIVPR